MLIKRIYRLAAAFISAVMLAGCAADKPELVRNSPPPTEKMSFAAGNAPNEVTTETAHGEQRAVWLTYIELADMFSRESCAEDFHADADGLFGELAELGLNTVYVHVRAFGDAFYDSELFTGTKYLGFDCDPLAIMTERAHAHGLMIHAWINPLRCDTEENMRRMDGTQIGEWFSEPEKYPGYVVQPEGDSYYWLNPAIPEVRRLAADGVRELCENYDIDGVHIDDYFYPTTAPTFDAQTYAAADTDMTLSDWRTENCSLLVSGLYSAVKSVSPEISFGISPQGNINNNYYVLYADVGRWCSEDGFCDYIVPQIYFGYDNAVCPFDETLGEWERMVTGGRQLVIGLGMYKTAEGGELSGGEYSGLIAEQIEDVMSDGRCAGFALYSCSCLTNSTDTGLKSQKAAAAAVIKDYKVKS